MIIIELKLAYFMDTKILKSSKFQLYIINMNKKIPIWLLGPYGSSYELPNTKGGEW